MERQLHLFPKNATASIEQGQNVLRQKLISKDAPKNAWRVSMVSSEALKDKITSLEAERSRLNSELENLRKEAESRAAALEGEVAYMRREAETLRQVLNPNEGMKVSAQVAPSAPVVATPVAVEQVSPVAQPQVSIPIENPAPATPEPAADQLDTVLETLNDDERKVVEVLLAHNGKYPQKFIRTEAKLSWLQTNRVISHLIERKLIGMEKDGVIENVVLAKELSQ